jgi:hypothetical protein
MSKGLDTASPEQMLAQKMSHHGSGAEFFCSHFILKPPLQRAETFNWAGGRIVGAV